MKNISYCDLKKGEIYAHFNPMSNKKLLILFELTDSQPIMETFSIITVKVGWYIDKNNKITIIGDYATNLQPDTDYLYHLDPNEYRTHFIIPQI